MNTEEPLSTREATNSEAAEKETSPTVVAGGAADDLRHAVRHHLSWITTIQSGVETLFHYFFVGCVGLLGLAIAFVVPMAILACVAVLLGIPGYLSYRWFCEPGEYFSTVTVIVTIFWSGYFVTHGWPRLRVWFMGLKSRLQPLLGWARGLLERASEDDGAES